MESLRKRTVNEMDYQVGLPNGLNTAAVVIACLSSVNTCHSDMITLIGLALLDMLW